MLESELNHQHRSQVSSFRTCFAVRFTTREFSVTGTFSNTRLHDLTTHRKLLLQISHETGSSSASPSPGSSCSSGSSGSPCSSSSGCSRAWCRSSALSVTNCAPHVPHTYCPTCAVRASLKECQHPLVTLLTGSKQPFPPTKMLLFPAMTSLSLSVSQK